MFHTTNKNRVNNLTQKYGYYLYELTQYLHELGYKSKGYINIVDQVFVAR